MPYELRTKESEVAHELSPQGREVLELRLKGREESQRDFWDVDLRGTGRRCLALSSLCPLHC